MNPVKRECGTPFYERNEEQCQEKGFPFFSSRIELCIFPFLALKDVYEGGSIVLNCFYDRWKNKKICCVLLKAGIKQLGEGSLRFFLQLLLIAWIFKQRKSRKVD